MKVLPAHSESIKQRGILQFHPHSFTSLKILEQKIIIVISHMLHWSKPFILKVKKTEPHQWGWHSHSSWQIQNKQPSWFPGLCFPSSFFFLFFLNKYLFIWLHWVLIAACRIFSCRMRDMWDLVPWSGIEPGSPTLGVQSLGHWTTREVPLLHFLLTFTAKLVHPELITPVVPGPRFWEHGTFCCKEEKSS